MQWAMYRILSEWINAWSDMHAGSILPVCPPLSFTLSPLSGLFPWLTISLSHLHPASELVEMKNMGQWCQHSHSSFSADDAAVAGILYAPYFKGDFCRIFHVTSCYFESAAWSAEASSSVSYLICFNVSTHAYDSFTALLSKVEYLTVKLIIYYLIRFMCCSDYRPNNSGFLKTDWTIVCNRIRRLK